MVDNERLLGLIDGIYAAAVDFTLWPATLQRIADAFGAQEAAIGGGAPQAAPWLVAPRTDPASQLSYVRHFHQHNLFGRRVARLPTGTVATDAGLFPDGSLQRSEFFNDWSKPQGYLTVMGSTLMVEDGWRTDFQIPGRRAFTADHLLLYTALAPHLVRAVQLNQRLQRSSLDRALADQMLDRMPQAAMFVDAGCRVVYANPAAEALFAAGRLALQDGQLAASGPVGGGPLDVLVGGCVRGEIGDSGGMMTIGQDPPSTLLVVPIRRDIPVMSPYHPVAVVFVSDPDTAVSTRKDALKRRFGLTDAEAAFALEIVKGDGKVRAAERRGISYSTARTHLSRIFEKTNTRRQAELVLLLMDKTAPGC